MVAFGSLRVKRPSTFGRGAKPRSSLAVFTDALSLSSKTSFGSSNASATHDVPASQGPLTPSSSVSSGLDSILNTPPALLHSAKIRAVALDEEVAAFEQLERNMEASRSRKQKRQDEKTRAQSGESARSVSSAVLTDMGCASQRGT